MEKDADGILCEPGGERQVFGQEEKPRKCCQTGA